MKNWQRIAILISVVLLFTLSCGKFFFAQESAFSPDLWSPESVMTYYISRGYGYSIEIVARIGHMIGNDDDVSVCLHLARSKGFDPLNVMGLRRSKLLWKQIMKSISFDPTGLFSGLSVNELFGVPERFKHAYGEYQKWKKDPSTEMNLTDDDVRDMVQLNFMVRMYGVDPREVMKARNSGMDWKTLILSGVK